MIVINRQSCNYFLFEFNFFLFYIFFFTHLRIQTDTFIDLVFINQPHLVMESGVHSSLSSTCHHEIIFEKLNLKAESLLPNAIDQEELSAYKTVESQVSVLNDLLQNIYSNYSPNKTVLCDDKNPQCLTNEIKTVIEMKYQVRHMLGKGYIRSDMSSNYYVRLTNLTTELSNLIRDTKTEYHSKLAAKLGKCQNMLVNFENFH